MKTQRMLTNKASLQFCVLSEKGAYFFFKKKRGVCLPAITRKVRHECVIGSSGTQIDISVS